MNKDLKTVVVFMIVFMVLVVIGMYTIQAKLEIQVANLDNLISDVDQRVSKLTGNSLKHTNDRFDAILEELEPEPIRHITMVNMILDNARDIGKLLNKQSHWTPAFDACKDLKITKNILLQTEIK